MEYKHIISIVLEEFNLEAVLYMNNHDIIKNNFKRTKTTFMKYII